MRSILKKQDEQKKQRKNNIILGAILVVIMLFSTAGYAFYGSDLTAPQEKTEEMGIEFEKTDYGYWQFNMQGYAFETKYLPSETADISVFAPKTLQDYQSKPLYFGIDTEEDIQALGNQEIVKNLQNFVLRTNYACLSEDCSEDYSIKNCSENNVIVFKQEDRPIVVKENDCIMIYTPSNSTERTADAFIFRLLGLK